MKEVLKKSNQELEERLREQSVELVRVNRKLRAKITELEQAEKLLRSQRDLAMALSSVPDLKTGLTECLETAIRMAGMNRGGIYLVDDKTGALDLVTHKGLSPDFVRAVSKYDADSPHTKFVMAGKPAYTRHQELEPPLGDPGLLQGLCAFAFVPIWHENRVIGCMNLTSESLEEIPLNSRPALEAVAAQIGTGIAQITAEDALRKSEEHLRCLMENADDFVVYRLAIDEQSPVGLKVVFVSPSITDIMGVSDPAKFDTWFENIHSDDIERITEANQKAFETLKFNEAMRFYHPTEKEWRWVRAVSNGTLDQNGNPRYINGIIIDITGRRKVEEALERANNELEERVRERTAELEHVNKDLQTEITERKELYRALRESEKTLRHMSTHLIRAQEKERKRIALELHDELGQALSLLKLKIGSIKKTLPQNQTELKNEFNGISDYIVQMVENVRRLSRDLSPRIIEDLGLSSALRWLAESSARHMNIETSFEMGDIDSLFSPEEQVTLYRIFQEAITNMVKHAKATRIWISAKKGEMEDVLIFIVKDNGVGFDLEHFVGHISFEKGLGLAAMNERAKMLGGSFEISSQKGIGTTITISVPIDKGDRR
jgi:PAS domain S-box-containing protein